ncbi:related to beta-glucosidase [Cephalotrichum gorgonifer]|uniref:beta-glucosidase n=1 Tax=Cephalotrichum gorgonifer TaxID=2041049 RepID=A0AAE8MPV0_9PEZI|nr:related to beta-glucosidase [Cephalotrichum gorgonifer]
MVVINRAALLLVANVVAVVCRRHDATPYLDTTLSPAERATDLLGRMTWEEKVGQLGGVRRAFGTAGGKPTFNRTTYETTRTTQNGQIGYGPQLNWANDLLPLMNNLRAEHLNDSRLGIPYIIVADSVNGLWVSGGTLFPGTISMASSWNLPLYEQVAAAMRDENLAMGVHWVLSPEVDVIQDPRNGRNGEMYGEDSYLVGEFATRYIKTMQERDENGWVKVATTIKHFVFGGGSGGVNRASMFGGINHILNDLAPPYRKAIEEARPLSLMASYSSVDGVPLSINRHLLQDVLRGTLGFEGLIMSDANAIEYLFTESKVASSREDAAVKALAAGLEHELHPGGRGLFSDLRDPKYEAEPDVVSLVDESVRAFLEIKFATGMFERPLPSVESMKATLRNERHLELNRNITRESLVMLKNDGLLPLDRDEIGAGGGRGKIAVLGPYADIINAGNYAPADPLDRRYGNSIRLSFEKELGVDSIIYAQGTSTILPSYVGDGSADEQAIAEAVEAAKAAGLAVIVLGSGFGNFDQKFINNERTDTEGYAHADLGFPGRQQQLLDAVLDAGVPTVLVMNAGQVFVLDNSTMSRCRAIFHVWLAGEYTGDALVETLLGDINPSGKLTVTMPQHNGAFPVAYDLLPSDGVGGFGSALAYDWHWPQLTRKPPLAFGFGLSYTTFSMSDAEVSLRKRQNHKVVSVSVTLTNAGNIVGKEVVQLYYRPRYTTIEFPVMKLIRFAKVELTPGDSKRVALEVPVRELGYFVDGQWNIDHGEYSFWVGSSSREEDLTLLNVTIPSFG